GHADAALRTLEPLVAEARKLRSPELRPLLRHMGQLAAAVGDIDGQLRWLSDAFEIDRKNGAAAAELAHFATEHERFDPALKILRHITLMDDPRPLGRGQAFLAQARIALHLGNAPQAELWAKKALREDPNLGEAQDFLSQVQAIKKAE